MAFNVGVNVLEVDGRASPTIVAAPISVAGLLVRSQRGVPGLAVHVQGMVDFVSSFGGPIATAFGEHAVRGFFENGGTEAFVVRMASATARAASVTLNDRAGAATLIVRAGQLGRSDPGVWGNALSIAIADHPRGSTAIPAQILGAAGTGAGGTFVLANNNTLVVEANGAPAVTVTFHTADFAAIGTARADEVAAAINRQTTAVRALATPTNRILLVSGVTGPASRIVLTGTARTALGFDGVTANSDAGLPAGTELIAVAGTGGLLPGSAVRIESRAHVAAPNALAVSLPATSGIDVTVTSPVGAQMVVPIRFSPTDFVGGLGAITAGEVVFAINQQARGFSAALQQANRLVLMTDRFGPGNAIDVAAPASPTADARAGLGLTGAAPVAGALQTRALTTVSEGQRVIGWTGGLPILANLSRVESTEFDLIVRRDGNPVERFETALPGQILGAAGPFVLVNNQTLIIGANGTPDVTVTFTTGDFVAIGAALASEVAALVNAQVPGVRAVATTGGRILLVSNVTGPASRIVVQGTAAGTLGFTGATANSDGALPAGTTLAAVAGVGALVPGSAVRIESRGHVIAANALAANTPATSGIDVTVTTANGPLPTVQIRFAGATAAANVVAAINSQAKGFTAALLRADRLVLMTDRFGPGNSIAVAAPAAPTADATTPLGLNGAAPVGGVREARALTTVSEGQRTIGWAGGLAVPTSLARVETGEPDSVLRRGATEVERFESLSMQAALNYDVAAVVNHATAGSHYIVVEKVTTNGTAAGLNTPALTAGAALGVTAGTDGTDGDAPTEADYLGDEAARTGFHALDTVGIQLLACPDTTAPGVVAGALAYCERRGDAMFVGTAPRGLDLDGVKAYASPFRARKVFGALYAPWIEIVNPLDVTGNAPRMLVPPVGHILGVYARIGEARGVWKAPAGDEAQIGNALAVEFDMTDREHTDLVRNGGVNGVRAIPGSGVILDASRTLSTDTRWLFVNVRRLFNFVKVSLADGLRFVSQEPNSEELRRMVRLNVVRPFLLGLWRQGAFGSDPPDQVFTIQCDPDNNPPAEVNLGNFRLDVFFYPVKPAETIVIVVGQQDSGAATAET
jgi:phage tail sheath protein FI